MDIKIVMDFIFDKKKLFCNLDLLWLLFMFMVCYIKEFLYFNVFYLVIVICMNFFKIKY